MYKSNRDKAKNEIEAFALNVEGNNLFSKCKYDAA